MPGCKRHLEEETNQAAHSQQLWGCESKQISVISESKSFWCPFQQSYSLERLPTFLKVRWAFSAFLRPQWHHVSPWLRNPVGKSFSPSGANLCRSQTKCLLLRTRDPILHKSMWILLKKWKSVQNLQHSPLGNSNLWVVAFLIAGTTFLPVSGLSTITNMRAPPVWTHHIRLNFLDCFISLLWPRKQLIEG